MSKRLTPVLVLVAMVLAIVLVIKGGQYVTTLAGYGGTNYTYPTANITNAPPTVEDVRCYDSDGQLDTSTNKLDLYGGTTRTVICNGTANDANGGKDINTTPSISARIYLSTAGVGCSADYRNCYVEDQDGTCSFTRKNETAEYVCLLYTSPSPRD